jgi:hypothetical protein
MRSFDPDEYKPDADPDYEPAANSVSAFKEQLRRDFEGLPFKQVFPGEVLTNDYGSCWRVSAVLRGALRRSDPEQARQSLLSSTSLVRGIRDRTQAKLSEQGYDTLADLESHPRFGPESRRIRELVEAGQTDELADILGSRLSRSHPSVLGLSALHADSDFLFLDIETMGLFAGQPVVVAGIAQMKSANEVQVDQYVVRGFPDELALVHEVCRQIGGHSVLVSYNGKSFDLPFLQGRSAYYGLQLLPPPIHFDLLHFCRRAWRAALSDRGRCGQLESCSLASIEQSILGISRDSDLPGEYVPEFYCEYLRTGNAGFLKPIVDHNRQDVASLVNVFSTLVELWTEDKA